jgi:hypothetical protein
MWTKIRKHLCLRRKKSPKRLKLVCSKQIKIHKVNLLLLASRLTTQTTLEKYTTKGLHALAAAADAASQKPTQSTKEIIAPFPSSKTQELTTDSLSTSQKKKRGRSKSDASKMGIGGITSEYGKFDKFTTIYFF